MIHRGVNGGNRFGFIGSSPHPAAYAQVPIAMRETFSDVPGMSANSIFFSRVFV
jgi:hypothetical protein